MEQNIEGWAIESHRVLQEEHTLIGMGRPHAAILLSVPPMVLGVLSMLGTNILIGLVFIACIAVVLLFVLKMLYRSDPHWLEYLTSYRLPAAFWYGE